jgi:hypothetical protein
MIKNNALIAIGGFVCLIACTSNFTMLFVFCRCYPGYRQLFNTMSELGASASTVSGILSFWWVIPGLLLILFGYCLRNAFTPSIGYTYQASWLVILYGMGVGTGSGLFKADPFKVQLLFTTWLLHL